MRLALLAALLGILFTVSASGQGMMTTGVGSAGGAGGPPPVCSNSLDFSQACNSQYIGVL